ncbi:MAG: hypothetical protein EBX51_06700, partial [Acidimicrobiia bacterium]|nr:hypothetical protein [Acidimicrobiia bacterium]
AIVVAVTAVASARVNSPDIRVWGGLLAIGLLSAPRMWLSRRERAPERRANRMRAVRTKHARACECSRQNHRKYRTESTRRGG